MAQEGWQLRFSRSFKAGSIVNFQFRDRCKPFIFGAQSTDLRNQVEYEETVSFVAYLINPVVLSRGRVLCLDRLLPLASKCLPSLNDRSVRLSSFVSDGLGAWNATTGSQFRNRRDPEINRASLVMLLADGVKRLQGLPGTRGFQLAKNGLVDFVWFTHCSSRFLSWISKTHSWPTQTLGAHHLAVGVQRDLPR